MVARLIPCKRSFYPHICTRPSKIHWIVTIDFMRTLRVIRKDFPTDLLGSHDLIHLFSVWIGVIPSKNY